MNSLPNYEKRIIFSKNLVAVHMKKTKLIFNKPLYVGACILDLSKTMMYDFHYNTIKKEYGERARLLFTDTDSLCYEIKTDDVYKDVRKIEDLYDFLNVPKDHLNYNTKNNKIIRKFKDECGGRIMTGFVGLRSKLYALKVGEYEEKKCKGVTKAVIKKNLCYDDYAKCLFTQQDKRLEMSVIRSYKHDIYAETVNKIALSWNDDKQIIRDDKIHTYAYGHYAS